MEDSKLKSCTFFKRDTKPIRYKQIASSLTTKKPHSALLPLLCCPIVNDQTALPAYLLLHSFSLLNRCFPCIGGCDRWNPLEFWLLKGIGIWNLEFGAFDELELLGYWLPVRWSFFFSPIFPFWGASVILFLDVRFMRNSISLLVFF